MSIYRKAVNNPVTTMLVYVALAIFGIFSLIKLSIDLYPEIDSNSIMVMTTYQGASAADIETNVSKVLENSLNAVSDLKHITSESKENVSVITLEFEYGIDIDVATNDVRDKLDMVSSYLPDGVNQPIIFKFNASDMPIMILSATADQSVNALAKILDDKLVTPLARVNGVGTVSLSGAPEREINIYCDPHKLEAYDLSVETISSIIAQENRNTPAGNIDIGTNNYSLRVQKEFTSAEQMLDIVVATKDGRNVFLRDVATVVDGLQEKYQEVYTGGRQGAQIIIQRQTGANTVNVIKGVKKQLAQIEKTLPSDIQLTTIIDSSTNIMNTVKSLKDTILITFVVVMFVVFIFLGRWRATFIIVLAIPISLLASLAYLLASGNTLNIISMSALSIAIGMVVDDAIVVLENVSTHISRGSKPKEAAVHATQEVAISVVASTLTMLAVFLPLTMIQGMSGVMFRQLGWIVSIIMIVSTAGALTLVPMMCSKMLVQNPKKGKIFNMIFNPINKALDGLATGYGKLIRWSVNHKRYVVAIALVVFLSTAMLLGPSIKTEYFPNQDQGRFSATVELPQGTNQEVARRFAMELNDRFTAEIPEIQAITFSEGQADTDNAFASMQDNGFYLIKFNVNVGSVSTRERSTQEIADYVRKALGEYPEIKKATVTEGMGGAGGMSTVDVEIYGYDFALTDRVAAELAAEMRKIEGCTQVVISRDEYTPEIQVDFDREKLAMNGLNTTTASTYLRNRVNGSLASYYREDGDEYDIRVRYAPEFRTSVEDIENIMVYNNLGQGVRIRDLGRVVDTLTPPTIERKDRERVITVSAVVGKGYALSDIVAGVNGILDGADIPSELMIKIGGTFEDQQDTFSDLGMLLVLIIILVYIVMASQFESFKSPFVIMFSIPFAFTGVIIGLSVTGTPMGVMALIGVIILMGIVVKNGIVLIDYTILCRERGMKLKEAVITASSARLRPILMTTLTTVLGMIPMAIGKGEGAEMWRSLGITVAWGLTISTLVTLVLIPVLYCAFNTRRARLAGELD